MQGPWLEQSEGCLKLRSVGMMNEHQSACVSVCCCWHLLLIGGGCCWHLLLIGGGCWYLLLIGGGCCWHLLLIGGGCWYLLLIGGSCYCC